MPKFLISFRLQYDQTYDDRRKSLVDAISLLSPLTWEEPTSLVHLECVGTSEGLRALLLANSRIYRDGRDELVIEMITVHSYASVGMKNETLFNMTTGTIPTASVAPVYPQPTGLNWLLPAAPSTVGLAGLSNYLTKLR